MQPSTARQIRVETDPTTLLRALSKSFTRPHSMLGELLQNARRAGATVIDVTVTDNTIAFRDDGCGIADLSILLSVAKSGWDAGVQEQEAPYGLGFLACLFGCREIDVRSRGQHMRAMTQDLLDVKPAGITAVEHDAYTHIELIDHKLGDISTVTLLIEQLTSGFPIPVHVNGEAMPRPFAMERHQWVESEMGWIREQDILPWRGTTRYYLQGLPIGVVQPVQYGPHARWGSGTIDRIVHLRSPLIQGRLPERDNVIDPDGVFAIIKRSEDALIRNALEAISSAGDVALLCQHANSILRVKAFDLLEKHQVVPGDWLSYYDGAPALYSNGWDRWWLGTPKGPVSFDSIRVQRLWACADNGEDADELLVAHYIRGVSGLEVHVGDSNALTWLQSTFGIIELDAADLVVNVQDQVGEYDGEFVYEVKSVIGCKAIDLSHKTHGPVALKPDAILDGGRLIITPDADTTNACKQFSTFMDENECHDEVEEEKASEQLSLISARLFGQDNPEVVLRSAMSYTPRASRQLLTGRRFTIAFGENGAVDVTLLED